MNIVSSQSNRQDFSFHEQYTAPVVANHRRALIALMMTAGVMKDARAFPLLFKIILATFSTYKFFTAARALADGRQNFAEAQPNGTGGAVDGTPKLMVPDGRNFGSDNWTITPFEAHGMNNHAANQGTYVFPNGKLMMTEDEREMRMFRDAVQAHGFTYNSDPQVSKRPIVASNGQGSMLVSSPSQIVDTHGRPLPKKLVNVVVAMRNQPVWAYPLEIPANQA
jgi:hypothetical protein